MASGVNTDCDEVIKSLAYFFGRVLPSAKREGEWSIGSIDRGLGWALFCENTAQDASLTGAITTYLDSKPFEECYTIEDVRCARSLLISSLFTNQLVTDDISQFLVEISSRELGNEETLSILNASVEKIAHYQTAVKILRKKPFEDAFINFKVRLLIESVANLSVPYEALNRLVINSDNLVLLLNLSQTLCLQDKNQFMNCLGNWMNQELNNENYFLFELISSLSVELINYLCNTFPGFHIKLLDVVHTLGDRLSSKNIEECRDDKVFRSLVRICHSFLVSQHLQSDTKSAFSTWVVSPEASFWHCLLIDAKKSKDSVETQ